MKTLLAAAILIITSCNVLRAQDTSVAYAAHCAHCHGADGGANTVFGRALKIPDVRSANGKKLSQAQLASIIGKGMDRGKMPGFRKKLGLDMVEQLASYVRMLRGNPPTMTSDRTIMASPGNIASLAEPEMPAAHPEGSASAIVPSEIELQHSWQKDTKGLQISTPATSSPTVAPAGIHIARVTPVDLNSANEQTLLTLPGITETDAANIVAGRPYKSTLQFKIRNVVSENAYAQIAERIVAKQPARKKQSSEPQEGTNSPVGANGTH